MYACEEQKDGYIIINNNGELAKYPKNYFRDVNVWDIVKQKQEKQNEENLWSQCPTYDNGRFIENEVINFQTI